MGFMGLLKFALLCFDFLAWPVFALGYPMFASIRAIETGSKRQMRKLVIYWTLFSLISLFEIAFVKFIEWIPFWSRIKLIATLLLVMPGFDGACYAYQSLIHPCLTVNLQGAIIDRFYKSKEEKPLKTETFLDVAEKYIKENGSEALEKLMATKRETRVVEAVEKNAAATSKQLKEPDASQKDKEMLEATEKSASTEAKQVQQLSDNVAWAQKETQAAAEVKEMTPLQTSEEIIHPETPLLKKVQQEWTCALCQVTATSEKMLNDHLHENKHKSKCEELKKSKQATGKSNQGNLEAEKNKVGEGSQQKCSQNTKIETRVVEAVEKNAAATSKQLKEPDAAQEDKQMLEATEKSASTEAKQVHQVSDHVGWTQKETGAAAEVEEMTPLETSAENRRPETPPLKKVQREWTCALCQVTTTSEKTLNAHLQGSKHKSKCEALKTSKHATGKSNQGIATQTFDQCCRVCNVRLLSEMDMASHLEGKRHSSNVRKMLESLMAKPQVNC